MKLPALLSVFLFRIISQTSAAIMRVAKPGANFKGAFQGASGHHSSPINWPRSLTEMHKRMEEGQNLALQPPLEPPLPEIYENSFLGLGESLRKFPGLHDHHLNVECEQYKMTSAHAQILKGGGGGGVCGSGSGITCGIASGGGRGQGQKKGKHKSGNAVLNATFSAMWTWISLAGNLALLRHLFNLARY
ncbi:uncharacterized protein MELLADRAFT_123228 [Melampsora larici-populina 98AG31]|uniref:Secreted protein n=1 Tax=Melampsora larici-populina (strain 98AG31 / pathotype 3-4-7) TaxID=747676 RepID=F4RPJ0_MELLP|nr:uncharacterized protein MELLADRAFT_123228 [Melampsora larici-populina 98AG31]EGG05539.1 secreted protein [Melampsora larici-populina 98AG31]